VPPSAAQEYPIPPNPHPTEVGRNARRGQKQNSWESREKKKEKSLAIVSKFASNGRELGRHKGSKHEKTLGAATETFV